MSDLSVNKDCLAKIAATAERTEELRGLPGQLMIKQAAFGPRMLCYLKITELVTA